MGVARLPRCRAELEELRTWQPKCRCSHAQKKQELDNQSKFGLRTNCIVKPGRPNNRICQEVDNQDCSQTWKKFKQGSSIFNATDIQYSHETMCYFMSSHSTGNHPQISSKRSTWELSFNKQLPSDSSTYSKLPLWDRTKASNDKK